MSTTPLERHQHDDRDNAGRFTKTQPCDGCGKPVGTNYFTDDEVCQGGDGPGFFLCERKRCPAVKLQTSDVETRRAHYTATRAKARGQ